MLPPAASVRAALLRLRPRMRPASPLRSSPCVLRVSTAPLSLARRTISTSSSSSSTNAATATSATTVTTASASVDPREIAKFSATSQHWWDVHGEYALLHRMNPCRVSYVRQQVEQHYATPPNQRLPFANLTFLDVGCGGGLLSESLARLGASTLGIDASASNVAIAQHHAAQDHDLRSSARLHYAHTTAEQLLLASSSSSLYDVVCSLEVIEHVVDPQAFVSTLASLVKPGGLLFIATMNRTALSWALTIGAAEHVLRWVRPGTHDWHKYVTVDELATLVCQARTETTTQPQPQPQPSSAPALSVHDVCGMVYNPLSRQWSLAPRSLDVNYIMCAKRTR